MMRIRKILWGRIYLWIFRPLYKLENIWPVWRIVNRNAVRHFERYGRKELSTVEKRIVAELKEKGVATTSLEELVGNGEKRLNELLSYAAFGTKPAHRDRIKPYISEYFDEIPTVTAENSFARLALDDRVLTIIGTYMGMTPKFHEFALAEITAVPSRTEKIGSMRWHRDPHDVRLCKMFLYLSDVGLDNGPFTYLTFSNYNNKYRALFPQIPPSGIYPPDGEVEKRINPADVARCIGKAGTIVFADTSGLHWGGHVEKGHRRMLTAGFLPPKSFLVRLLSYKKTGEGLSPLQEYAALVPDTLVSRKCYIALKKILLGAKSLGSHITGMNPGM